MRGVWVGQGRDMAPKNISLSRLFRGGGEPYMCLRFFGLAGKVTATDWHFGGEKTTKTHESRMRKKTDWRCGEEKTSIEAF